MRLISPLFAALLLVLSLAPAGAQETAAPHPLDGLSFAEIERTVAIVKGAGLADGQTMFPTMTLLEPPKGEVLAWTPGQAFSRRALVVTRKSAETTRIVVDLRAGTIVSREVVADAQPSIMQHEWAAAGDQLMADARWQAAMRKAGYQDLSGISCTPMPPGAFPKEPYGARRILRVSCYEDSTEPRPQVSRSIEGILGIVDADTGAVIDVKVEAPVIRPAAEGPVPAPSPLPAQKPVINASPSGTNIRVSGAYEVEWQNWSFHLRADRRSGLVVSLVRFQDQQKKRLVAYQMALAELFVPYMDPALGWNTRNYLDAGELGLGYLVSTLAEGKDCPTDSFYLDLLMPSDQGGMFKADSALCIFERATGSPAWRHFSAENGTTDARAEVELVVRTIPTIGNYDYIVDYVFSSRGAITTRVGATGIDAVKTVTADSLASPTAAEETRYGALVAPRTVAPYHDHYFAFRLDLDIDGPQNTLVAERFVPEQLPAENVRGSLWRLQPEIIREEGPVSGSHHGAAGEIWRVINPDRRTALGYAPGYEIMPEHGTATSMLKADDPAQRRAAFSASTLWVSRANPSELYPVGDFPLVTLDDGLPRFVTPPEPIENQDLVFWYTVGFRHVTRPEDWPILPTMWHGFVLRPYGFFDRDPSASLPPVFAN
ncbi:primary-amine oxidase [Rhodoligotrophos appendicifer]|uniref:copper amine oxidase n=1 Tax=Rhodoligotrophos appendicifer TaxID=987056 RepID=UPI001186C1E4|nr:hypothetical protein [Rhodoligotrophos appendicifer]